MRDRRGPEAKRIVERAFKLSAALPPELRVAHIRTMINVLKEPLAAYVRDMMRDLEAILASEPETPGWRVFREWMEERGEARGRARAKAEDLILILTARKLEVDAETRAKIDSCTDLAKLEEWMLRALTATSLADVFGNG